MKKFVCLVLSLFVIGNVFAQNDSSKAANRRTSLRYLQLSKQYVSESDWNSTVKSCAAGLEYDDTVADLYYLEALGLINMGYSRFEVLPIIAKALDDKTVEWVDYNQSNARVFYADLLACTGKPEQAIAVLDKAPLVYSSDAEYVRIKSYYEINTPESIAKAEEKIDTVRRIYPNDARFFYLFFGYEYNLLYKENETKTGFDKQPLNPTVKKICDSFISHVPDYDNGYDDLEIYASIFADGENQRRLLKAFDARGFKNVLYPIAALEAEVISEEEAVDYFLNFIDGELDAKILFQFYSMITDESLKQYMDEHLNAFKGTLVYDTNNNLEANLIVKYERGRAVSITYDKDNDSNLEWEVTCDFGSPKEIIVYDQSAIVKYGTYPNVNAILFKDIDPYVEGPTIYTIIDESFESKPFEIGKTSFVSTTDFYVVDEKTLKTSSDLFDVVKIVNSANTMTKPTLEVKGGHIVFSILDGTPNEAQYFTADNVCYAHALFYKEGYVCVVREIDRDRDGLFETDECYSVDDGKMNLSKEEKEAITTNIWGSPLVDSNICLSQIRIDTNKDTNVDFWEMYYPNDEKVTVWDNDFDNEVDTIYKKNSRSKDGKLVEENSYLVRDYSKKRKWITIVTERNGSGPAVPLYVIDNSLDVGHVDYESYKESVRQLPFMINNNRAAEKIAVVKGTSKNFYWLGQKEDQKYEKENNLLVQGQVVQINFDDCYVRYILIGSNIFAKRIAIPKAPESEKKDDSDVSTGDDK